MFEIGYTKVKKSELNALIEKYKECKKDVELYEKSINFLRKELEATKAELEKVKAEKEGISLYDYIRMEEQYNEMKDENKQLKEENEKLKKELERCKISKQTSDNLLKEIITELPIDDSTKQVKKVLSTYA